MTHTRYTFVEANWPAEIVGRFFDAFLQLIPAKQIDRETVQTE